MNYQRIYENLVKQQNRIKLNKNDLNYVYYEKHHIIPKCLGGLDIEENLVLLTAKEHYLAHKLLIKIYPNNIKILRAFSLMVYMNKLKYILSARDYAYAIELYRNTPVSEETKEKIRQHGNKGRKFSDEFKQNISRIRIEKELSKGKNNPMFGKKHKQESIQKMKNRIFSEETKNLMKQNHANISGENNPMFGKNLKWITKDGKNKRIKEEKIDFWLNDEWKLGKTWTKNIGEY